MFDSNNNKAFRDLQELIARKMKLVSEQKAPASPAGSDKMDEYYHSKDKPKTEFDKKTEFNTSKEPSEKPFNVSEESPEKGERVPGPWNEIDDPVKMPAPIPPRTGDSGPAIAPKYPPAPPGYKSSSSTSSTQDSTSTQDTEPNPSGKRPQPWSLNGPPGSKYTREAPPMSFRDAVRDAYAHDATRKRIRTAMSTAASRAINAGLTGKTPGSRPVYPQDDGNTIY